MHSTVGTKKAEVEKSTCPESNSEPASFRETVGGPRIEKLQHDGEPYRRTWDALDRFSIAILELRLAFGSNPAKSRALEELVRFYSRRLKIRGMQIACQWGLENPIEGAREAVQMSAFRAMEEMDGFEAPEGISEPFFDWMNLFLIEELRKIKNEQTEINDRRGDWQ